jgi:hypothetical protein
MLDSPLPTRSASTLRAADGALFDLGDGIIMAADPAEVLSLISQLRS